MTGDNTPSTSHLSVVSVSDPDYLLIQHCCLFNVSRELCACMQALTRIHVRAKFFCIRTISLASYIVDLLT
jgi:hypothetical protein